MEKQLLDSQQTTTSPPQWSLWSLLMTTALIAAWLGAWRVHFLVGFVLTLVLLPAVLFYCVMLYWKADSEGAKLRAFAAFVTFGAGLPPLVALSLNPLGSLYEIAARLAVVSFIGASLAAAYGIYIFLCASLLEILFGPPSVSK